MENQSIEELIYDETKKRLTEMESGTYEFPKRITSSDKIAICTMLGISLLLIVLCMVGVIQ